MYLKVSFLLLLEGLMFLGRFELLLMYIGSLLGFLYGWYVLSLRFKRISRKSPDVKFVLMVMFKPQHLNIFNICFRFRSISSPDIFFIIPRPLSRYNPTSSFRWQCLVGLRYSIQLVYKLHFRLNNLWGHQNFLFLFFSPMVVCHKIIKFVLIA